MATSPSLLLVLVATLVVALFSPAVVLASGREQRTRIRVYVHEQFSGPNATVGSVSPSPLGANSTFGEVGVVDDVLRAGPDPSSPEVGRYQGLFAGADLADANYFSAITLVFTAGEHYGSTLSIQGKYGFPGDEVLERAVVGGTGGFRLARGFSLLQVVSTPPEAAVFQLDLVVFTPRPRRD
ncbi:hypothetical protein HU200_046062 [Digitaria exilis]|uniref:Dirigent protein n=1 Tax=Digitaria exilis TaxID=1010633 RepID=A0A835B766_9POAL|nr:hypothetical protein HU200_046062 [Digitaria exilis]